MISIVVAIVLAWFLSMLAFGALLNAAERCHKEKRKWCAGISHGSRHRR